MLRFACGDGDPHAFARFDAAHGAIESDRVIGGEAGAEAGADPEQVFGFDEHAVFGDVAGAAFEASGTPLDFEGRLKLVARRSSPFVVATRDVLHRHGRETPHGRWRAKVELELRACVMKIRRVTCRTF